MEVSLLMPNYVAPDVRQIAGTMGRQALNAGGGAGQQGMPMGPPAVGAAPPAMGLQPTLQQQMMQAQGGLPMGAPGGTPVPQMGQTGDVTMDIAMAIAVMPPEQVDMFLMQLPPNMQPMFQQIAMMINEQYAMAKATQASGVPQIQPMAQMMPGAPGMPAGPAGQMMPGGQGMALPMMPAPAAQPTLSGLLQGGAPVA